MAAAPGRRTPVFASRAALAIALAMPALPAWAQAPETQTQANPAPAQDAASATAAVNNTSGGVEEIVVTAQFREQNLQETPLAITAMSGAMLEARSQTNVGQIADQAPSVTLKPQGAAFGPSLGASIRGVGQFDFNPALEPGVGVYVDDVYYATLTGSIFDLLDLERVEVLRGPQGTLAGKNSIGGAIKLYSKKPTGDGSGYISATYGSRDRLDLRGSADFAIADNLYARLAGVSKKQGGYVKRLDYGCVNPDGGIPRILGAGTDCVIAKEGEVDYNAVRGQLRWVANDDIEVNIIGDYTHDDRVTAGSVLTYADYPGTADINPYGPGVAYDSRFICGKFCNYASYVSPADDSFGESRVNGRTKFNGWGVSGKVDWRLGERLSLESISAYRAYNTKFSNDDDQSPMAHSLGQGDLDFWSFSQEVRLNGTLGASDQIEFTLGGFYMDQKSTYATFQDLRYAGLTPFMGNDPVKADTKAVFAHATWNLTDQLAVTGGIRYTDESKDYTFSRYSPDGTLHPTLGSLTGVTGHYKGDRVDYRANVQYKLTDDIMAYGQFSTGFKGGGVNPRPFAVTQVQSFGPETLKSYELGLKTDLFDRLIRLNLAGFYSDYKDIQLALLSCPQYNPSFLPPGASFPCALPQNAGDAHIKGFEAELSIRPAEGLMFDGSLSYLDFEYQRINPQAGGPTMLNGVQLSYVPPFVPSWKWSAGVQYEIALGDVGSLTPRIDLSYQGAVYTNSVNAVTNRIPSYVLGNARLTYRNTDSDWEASLEVTNLFDKYYYLTSFDLTGAGAGVSSAQPGRPREWALTVKKKF